jgi:hypothetical protein
VTGTAQTLERRLRKRRDVRSELGGHGILDSHVRPVAACGAQALPGQERLRGHPVGVIRSNVGTVHIVVATWLFVGGLCELFAASQTGETPGTRAMLILAGLVSIAFAVVIAARPGIGAISLALLFGLYSLVFGVWEIVAGVDLRR